MTQQPPGDAIRKMLQAAIRTRTLPADMPEFLRAYLRNCDPEDVWAKPTPDAMRRSLEWLRERSPS